MRRALRILTIIVVMTSSGCASTGVGTSQVGGGTFFHSTAEGVMSTGKPPGPYRGVACARNYLGAVSEGDASIEAAQESAGIREVSTVERLYFRVLGLYGQVCTVVTGR
jgi:hypothetical protein